MICPMSSHELADVRQREVFRQHGPLPPRPRGPARHCQEAHARAQDVSPATESADRAIGQRQFACWSNRPPARWRDPARAAAGADPVILQPTADEPDLAALIDLIGRDVRPLSGASMVELRSASLRIDAIQTRVAPSNA
jgi:hypothetical protein